MEIWFFCSAVLLNIFADVPHLFRSSHRLNIVWMSSSPINVLFWPWVIEQMRTILAHCFRLAAASSRCFFQFSLAIYNQSHLGSLSQNIRVALCPCGKQEETVTLHLPWLLRSFVAVDSAQCTADNVIILLVPNWAKSRYLIHSVRTEWSFFMRIVANYLRRAVIQWWWSAHLH